MQQKEGFFKIKPQEAWTDPLDGCIVETQNAIVALNIVPASFGHVLVFPKNQHARDFNDTDNSGTAILSDAERQNLMEASQKAIEEIHTILNEDPERIITIYEKWINNDKLMSKIPGCKEKLQTAIAKRTQSKKRKGENIGHYFENRGPHSGRMISTYHSQYVPQHYVGGNQIVEVSDALYSLLNEKSITTETTLTRNEVLNQEIGVLWENKQFRAVFETTPASFGHIAITWKDEDFGTNINNCSLKDRDALYEFLNKATAKLQKEINNNPDSIKAFYHQQLEQGTNKRIKTILEKIKSKRNGEKWEIETAMKEKNITEFYNGGGSFFPSIKTAGVYHFVPRYAFDREKAGTGTALFQAHNQE